MVEYEIKDSLVSLSWTLEAEKLEPESAEVAPGRVTAKPRLKPNVYEIHAYRK